MGREVLVRKATATPQVCSRDVSPAGLEKTGKAVQSGSTGRLFILTWRYGKSIKWYFLFQVVSGIPSAGQLRIES
jgi:hypothetical protein